MNHWTQLSVDLANQRNYLDLLFRVYPMSNNLVRELSISTQDKLGQLFETRDNTALIELLLKQELFPIKDSYVAYLKRDSSAIARNPETVNRLAGSIYSLGLEKTISNMTLPKETNRQIGPLFKRWIDMKEIGCEVTRDIQEFLSYEGNIIYNASDNAMKEFAINYLGYTNEKGLDFIAKFNNKIIVGETKFLTDFGGHQNAQINDALTTMRSLFNTTNYQVVPIAILDGVCYIPNKGKMHSILENLNEEEVVISSLLLRDYLYSL